MGGKVPNQMTHKQGEFYFTIDWPRGEPLLQITGRLVKEVSKLTVIDPSNCIRSGRKNDPRPQFLDRKEGQGFRTN